MTSTQALRALRKASPKHSYLVRTEHWYYRKEKKMKFKYSVSVLPGIEDQFCDIFDGISIADACEKALKVLDVQ
jgi:hypothetical protein